MKSHSSQLLNTIDSYASARCELVTHLGSNTDFIGIYYLAPLANLQQILASGGIRPRNLVHQLALDCSWHTVQSQREYPINLMDANMRVVESNIHDCVNFFLNPINDTLYQFRRNARLAVAGKAMPVYMGALCLIELDLASLLNNSDLAWAVSDRNVASGEVKICSEVTQYCRYDWRHIYSIEKEKYNRDEYNRVRSAEFLIYPDHDDMRHIAIKYIHRVIIFKSDNVPLESLNINQNYIYKIQDDPIIPVFDDPLSIEKRFWKDFKGFWSTKEISKTLDQVFDDLQKIEIRIGRSLGEDFEKPRIASGVHGVGHVTRVIFWVVILTHLARENGFPVSDDDLETAAFAAYTHDLCRTSDLHDDQHGLAAVQKFAGWLYGKLTPMQCISCMVAVAYHCRVDAPEHTDIVWQLLKDADALDRGRFNQPEKPRGCDLSYLTHPMFQGKSWLAKECAWSAYQFAKMTKDTNWGLRTVSSLLEMLRQSNRAIKGD